MRVGNGEGRQRSSEREQAEREERERERTAKAAGTREGLREGGKGRGEVGRVGGSFGNGWPGTVSVVCGWARVGFGGGDRVSPPAGYYVYCFVVHFLIHLSFTLPSSLPSLLCSQSSTLDSFNVRGLRCALSTPRRMIMVVGSDDVDFFIFIFYLGSNFESFPSFQIKA